MEYRRLTGHPWRLIAAIVLGGALLGGLFAFLLDTSQRFDDLNDQARQDRATAAALTAQVEALGEEPVAEPDTSDGKVTPIPGPEGPQGRPGRDGRDGSPCLPINPFCVGPKGDTGETGATGEPGESIVGPEGPAGESIIGPQGPEGATGPQGVGIANVQINDDCHLIVTLTDGTVIDAGEVCKLAPPPDPPPDPLGGLLP